MTNHMEDRPYVYAGLCLENALLVTTRKRKRYVALCRIIEKIVTATVTGERSFAERYPDMTYKPFKDLRESLPTLEIKFKKRMKNAIPLNEYVNIKRRLEHLWEKQAFDPEENEQITFESLYAVNFQKLSALFSYMRILSRSAPIMYDCKEMTLAARTVQKSPLLKDSTIIYHRV
jgi:hypothetical protein